MASILLLYAHPAPHKSRVNARLFEAVTGLPGVTARDLYQLYPDLMIDVEDEQRLLADHDVVVLQHPLYWYSSPAIVKEWLDLVLQYGWAYGPGGTALAGKRMLSAITTGGGRDAYRTDGHNRWTIRQLLAPFDQTAHLCGMEYLPPFVVHGSGRLSDADVATHTDRYRAALAALRDGAGDPDALRRRDYWNRDDDPPDDWRPRQVGGTHAS